MEVKLANGKASLQISDSVFAASFNESLIHQIVVAYLAAGRAGTKGQKNRSAVRGGGAKPWRQKGTGRARAGSIRSPLWRGGGKTFAAENRDFSQKVNRKMYRGALRSILSELVRQDRISIVDDMRIDEPKTKALITKLSGWTSGSCLIVMSEYDQNIDLASRNIPYLSVLDVSSLDPVSLVASDKVIVTKDAIRKIEEWLA